MGKKKNMADLLGESLQIQPPQKENYNISTIPDESNRLKAKGIKRKKKVQQPDEYGRISVTSKVSPQLWDFLKMYATTKKLTVPEALDKILLAFFNQRKKMDLSPYRRITK